MSSQGPPILRLPLPHPLYFYCQLFSSQGIHPLPVLLFTCLFPLSSSWNSESRDLRHCHGFTPGMSNTGSHKLLLKISLVSLCLFGWVWGDLCRFCKVFIINHRIIVLAESHTNSFFFLQFVFSVFSLLLSLQLFPLFKFIWIIINAS